MGAAAAASAVGPDPGMKSAAVVGWTSSTRGMSILGASKLGASKAASAMLGFSMVSVSVLVWIENAIRGVSLLGISMGRSISEAPTTWTTSILGGAILARAILGVASPEP